jgi:hypothetical protein
MAGNAQHHVRLLQFVQDLVMRQEIVPASMSRNMQNRLLNRVEKGSKTHTIEIFSCSSMCCGTGSGISRDVAVNMRLQP